MSAELNNNERIKKNMATAWEWMNDLGFQINNVSVFDFSVTLMAGKHSIESMNKILEVAKEKGVSFNISRSGDSGFTYYTSEYDGLNIYFTN